jgi:hypothetical protein
MKEMDMAKAMMAKKDMKGCEMHMDRASRSYSWDVWFKTGERGIER